jgi:nucleoside-diphosphate-sugar epimerase
MRFDTLLNELVRDAVVDGWLLVYGRESYRTLAHVGDITQMVSLVIAKRDEATGRVFNVGGGHITKVGLARLIQQYVPDVEIEYKDQKADPRDYRASYDRALSFGFKPQYTVRDGVAEVSSALKNGLFSDPHSSLYRNVQ